MSQTACSKTVRSIMEFRSLDCDRLVGSHEGELKITELYKEQGVKRIKVCTFQAQLLTGVDRDRLLCSDVYMTIVGAYEEPFYAYELQEQGDSLMLLAERSYWA